MPNAPRAWVYQDQIAEGLRRAERALRPDVVRIRFSFEDDWTGDYPIFFKVVLSDDAAGKEGQLAEIAERVMSTVVNETQLEELGLTSYYFSFRSFSEQNELNEPAWA